MVGEDATTTAVGLAEEDLVAHAVAAFPLADFHLRTVDGAVLEEETAMVLQDSM